MDGILLIDKPKNVTSRMVVNEISKKLNIKKIGHTGTLDPIATGVLVLCIGKATKLVDIITAYDKEYIATVILGLQTDTLDITGNVLLEQDTNFSYKEINNVLKTFKGSYDQEVPIYSAVKIKGRKLYEYARNNEFVIPPKRKVWIKEVELLNDILYENNKTIFKFRVLVSKGTYIRSLIYDIAQKLNTVGVMKSLIRTKQGKFQLENCSTIENINLPIDLISIKEILKSFFTVIVNEELKVKIKNGAIIDDKYGKDEVLFIDQNKNVLALYQLYYKDNTKLKPWKMFI